jgi:hypothetical protein
MDHTYRNTSSTAQTADTLAMVNTVLLSCSCMCHKVVSLQINRNERLQHGLFSSSSTLDEALGTWRVSEHAVQ